MVAASGFIYGVTRGILSVAGFAGGVGAHVFFTSPVALLCEERASPGALAIQVAVKSLAMLAACVLAAWDWTSFRLAVALMTKVFLTPTVFCVVLVACAGTHATAGVTFALHADHGGPLPQSDVNEEELQTFPFEQGCSACTADRKPHKRTASGSGQGQGPLGQAPPNYGGCLPGVGPELQRVC
ncbi:unnamed protein product [Prorocentrum cordatum]|uniref:Uncharacterized protein n=1 Tax=Prorocentrum cordatum TaxID=2364126 RepID=A0ABN9SLE5_9DINO|nr:unnamed protein product [Polarella glacialis]